MKDSLPFRELLTQALLDPSPSIQLIEWQSKGILKEHFNILDKSFTIKQDARYHIDTVFMHCLKTCDNTPTDISLRWAGLLHDLGKVETVDELIVCGKDTTKQKITKFCIFKEGKKCTNKCPDATLRTTFYRHEVASERIARKILNKFKVMEPAYSMAVGLVANHMYNYSSKWTDKALFKFIARTKITESDLERPDDFPLFRLRIADRLSRGLEPVTQKQRDFEERLRRYFVDNSIS